MKIVNLKVDELKEHLRRHELPTTGTKAELVLRLSECINSDEIEVDNRECNLQTQVDELRGMMENMMSMMSSLSAQTQSSQNRIRNESVNFTPQSTVGRNESVKVIAETIPEFNPTDENSLTVEQFIDRVNSALRAYEWDEKCLLLAIYGKLKGVARMWLDAAPSFYSNWSSLANDLKSEFGYELNEAQVHHKMINTTRKQNEKVVDYCFRMSGLGRRYKLTEKATIKYIRDGLKYRELQTAIAAIRFDSIKEMRESIENYLQNASVTKNFKTENVNKENVNGAKTANESAVEKKTVACYNCNDVGHIARNCPKPRQQRRVKSNNSASYNADQKANVKCAQYHHQRNLCEKIISMNGKSLLAFVDTGSECSLIRRSVADNINKIRQQCSMEIKGICGGKRFLTEKIEVNINIDNVIINVNLFIVENEMLSTDVLLGQDLFNNKIVKVEIKNNEMIFSQQVIKVENKYAAVNSENIICSIDDVTIKNKLQKLLENYKDVFAESLNDIGLTKEIQMKIELTSDIPVAQRPYRVPEPKKHVVKEIIDELLACDIIEKSKSEYASPMILVKKKTGGERLCVDYRRLNQNTIKEIFPTPNIEERLSEAMKFKYFSVLDLNSGYYQVPIEKEYRKLTAFITTDGLFQFKRMPFGLRNAPAVFQRLMQIIKDKTRPGDMIHYMDDILVGSSDIDEMSEKLTRVFEALRKMNLTLNLNKCEFFKQSIEFLGHQLHPGGISPGSIKTAAVSSFSTPKSTTDVRRFLGLSGYFRRFVPGYSIKSEPLRRILRKEQIFYWGEPQEEAFLALKEALTTKPVMTGYRAEADHQIHTDASALGIAGVLLQREGSDWKPVAYYSRSTTDTEQKYHSYELETLAVVSSLERFRYYVQGKEIVVVTDCNAVTTAMHKRELIPRIARWWLRIQDFLIKLEHRPGRRMEHVDFLSRMPYENSEEIDTASLKIAKADIEEGDWVYCMQHQDTNVREIIDKLSHGDKVADEEYKIEKGRLYRKDRDKKLWVVPKSMRYKIIQNIHEKMKHLGVEKTIEEAQKYFWFPRMRNFVKSYMKSCIECAYNKQRGGKIEGEYHYDEIEPVPFKTVHLDHLGPFPRSKKLNEHIIVVVDAFTKFTVARAVKSTATRHVLLLLNEISSYFGVPTRIVTDRGSAFTSKDFKQYCIDNDIKHILNAVRTPRANGHAERTNRTILSMLLPSTSEDRNWDDQLRGIQWALNTSKNKTTQRTPHELLLSFKPRDILQNKLILALHQDEVYNEDHIKEIQENAASRVNLQRKKAKQIFDDKHCKPTQYNIGDLVVAQNEPVSMGGSRKLEPLYKGPFIITKVIGNDRYLIEDIPGSKRKQRHYTSVFASDKLKPWCQLPNFDGFGDDSDEGEGASNGQDWSNKRQ